MDIVVRQSGPRPHMGRLTFQDRTYRCALGCNGTIAQSREGARATPEGSFPLRRVLYRADRIAAPVSRLPLHPIGPRDGWCDSPDDPAYNRPVRLPYPASHERLVRKDHLYDIVTVLGHNDDPVIPGAGSAIFMHVARPDYGPTLGCIALAEADLRTVLAGVSPMTQIRIESSRC